MALESTQPLTEMSTGRISWGVKSGRCVRLTTYHHLVPLSRNMGTLTSWNPLGLSRPVMVLLYLYLYTAYRPITRQPSTTLLQELGITFRTMALYNIGKYMTFMQPG